MLLIYTNSAVIWICLSLVYFLLYLQEQVCLGWFMQLRSDSINRSSHQAFSFLWLSGQRERWPWFSTKVIAGNCQNKGTLSLLIGSWTNMRAYSELWHRLRTFYECINTRFLLRKFHSSLFVSRCFRAPHQDAEVSWAVVTAPTTVSDSPCFHFHAPIHWGESFMRRLHFHQDKNSSAGGGKVNWLDWLCVSYHFHCQLRLSICLSLLKTCRCILWGVEKLQDDLTKRFHKQENIP